jgi:transcriptional regulator with PAS, ATPase and Fis domain
MCEILDVIRRIAASQATTVLLEGESGVGKDLFANEIHRLSERRNHPFLAVNCAAIPGDLLESELFGYEAGAFTGARVCKPGLLELSDRGTLFLDAFGRREG